MDTQVINAHDAEQSLMFTNLPADTMEFQDFKRANGLTQVQVFKKKNGKLCFSYGHVVYSADPNDPKKSIAHNDVVTISSKANLSDPENTILMVNRAYVLDKNGNKVIEPVYDANGPVIDSKSGKQVTQEATQMVLTESRNVVCIL